MPLYEYECPKDGAFEQMQKFSDPPLAACPKCGGPVEKLLSAPAIQFKGSGWYVTDYARKDAKGAKGSESKASDSTAKSETKTETKSDSASTKESSGSTKSTSSSASASS